MKRYIVFLLIISLTNAYSKDFHKTEDMINSILTEENESSAIKDEKTKPAETETGTEEKTSEEAKTEEKPAQDEGENAKKTAMSGKDEILLKTGIQLYESGMYDHSLSRFNDLIKDYPTSKFIDSARMWAGKIYIRKYQYDSAIKEFDGVSEKSGEYPASLFFKAEALRIKGDTVGAIENYQKVYSTYPDNELADNSILITGKLYMGSGKGYQALESALKIVRYYKDSESVDDAYYLIAKIYEKDPMLKDLEISRKFYRTFLKKAENNQKHFSDSPLIDVVKKDLQHLDKSYFKSER